MSGQLAAVRPLHQVALLFRKEKHQKPLLLLTWLSLTFTKTFKDYMPVCLWHDRPSGIGLGHVCDGKSSTVLKH